MLIEAYELGWHRARYRTQSYLCMPADIVLVRGNALLNWAWERLQGEVTATVANIPSCRAVLSHYPHHGGARSY